VIDGDIRVVGIDDGSDRDGLELAEIRSVPI
jgi:hypothetical protein